MNHFLAHSTLRNSVQIDNMGLKQQILNLSCHLATDCASNAKLMFSLQTPLNT
jgi:hypothetical protein